MNNLCIKKNENLSVNELLLLLLLNIVAQFNSRYITRYITLYYVILQLQ